MGCCMRRVKTLAVLGLVVAAGCFTKVSVDPQSIHCTVNDDCPAGYTCTEQGACCTDSDPTCGARIDATPSIVDSTTSEAGIKTSDSQLSDGIFAFGDTTISADANPDVDASVTSQPSPDGPQRSDAHDVPTDSPLSPPDDSGARGCTVDHDCPAAAPLCLANKCAKCGADSDCVERAAPACDTTSGLCVACTGDKHCTGITMRCNTTTQQCTGCVTRNDCLGACQACTNGVCTSVKNQDDPGVCIGTCDSTGACKAKQGQTCKAGTDCLNGICADGYCCNSICNKSCEACNLSGSVGLCTPLPNGTPPQSGHPPCSSSDSRCPSGCQGGNECSYSSSNGMTCGQATCSNDHLSYQYAGTCSSGTCNLPGAVSCGSGKYCTGAGACVAQKSTGGGPCSNNYECTTNTCSGEMCCIAGMTGCSGTCTNVTADNANCGSCGHACGSGQTCCNGKCLSCGSGETCCNGACMDITSDSNNCGFCGYTCGTDYACGNGSCRLLDGKACGGNAQCLSGNCSFIPGGTEGYCCPSGTGWCDGMCVTGTC